MTNRFALHEVGRLPLPGDNVAIATRRLPAGALILDGAEQFMLDHTIMEGHRFAIQPIGVGEPLLSWNLPFGVALKPIAPGAYVCNEAMLEALRLRNLDFVLPDAANFADRITPYVLAEADFQPAAPVPLVGAPRTFLGFRRGAGRGVGTRNLIVLLGTTSRTGGFVRQLEARLKAVVKDYPNIDGIVAAAHTEGDHPNPNNRELLLRTLAGFMVNPNVGAVLAVDYGVEAVNNAMLRQWITEHDYPLADVPHEFLSIHGGFQENLDKAETIVRGWLDQVNDHPRSEESVADLKIALQCGGSDAFSGISGNPLLGWVAHEVVRSGGAANLAETDELIGAESYVLNQVRDPETARRFLRMVERFKEYASWHGASAEGNPSGGNKFRGLYNITLKSIGAAMKKDPRTRLDYAIDYGEPMRQPGYYFMDSPGNDLESIAGQVAAGCNLIFFVTGNGSVTNFPFVPTIKIVTTTRRYELLRHDMDVNAGAYLDGASMDELGQQTFDYVIEVASGRRSSGERAGHAQVQIWRNWPQTDTSRLEALFHTPQPTGAPIPIQDDVQVPDVRIRLWANGDRRATDRVGLILPTSLCASQVAGMTALRLNKQKLGREQQISRFVALAHTEGCGNNAGPSEEMSTRTLLSYITHPLVRHCLLLEHGCEKTHNDHYRHAAAERGLDLNRLGWASIQLDGGIDEVMRKVEQWFAGAIAADRPPVREEAGLEALRLGLISSTGDGQPLDLALAEQLARLTKMVVKAGGIVVAPENSGLLSTAAYRGRVLRSETVLPSLAYGEAVRHAGFHLMETPTEHWVETLTGLAATGVEVILAVIDQQPMPVHPLAPVVQITADLAVAAAYGDDLDLVLSGDSADWIEQIFNLLVRTLQQEYTPKLYQRGNIDFQLTRGLLGVTL
jgi:altronate dehydratase